MKVLVVMPSATKHGGAEATFLHLLQERGNAGLDLTVCFLEKGELANEAQLLGVETTIIDAGRLRDVGRFFRAVYLLRRRITSIQPEIILAWMTKAHIYSGLAALGTSAKPVYFQHGLPDGGRVDLACRIVPAAGALACSRFVAKEQQRCVRHRVIPVQMAGDSAGSHPFPRDTAEAKRRLGLDPHAFLVGIVGRLQRWKGMHVYLEAMSRVTKKYPGVRGVIVGGVHGLEPDYPETLKQLRSALGLDEKIAMVGKQTNVGEWMSAMDVFVHASEREPFGLVVLEAMACGVPTIASIPGGPEEIIAHKENGMLVPSGDAGALAEAIEELIKDPSAACKLASKARERSKDFGVDTYVASVRAALVAVCGDMSPLLPSTVRSI